MGGVFVLALQQLIQSALRIRRSEWHVNAEPPQSRSPNGDEQGGHGFDPKGEIAESGLDEVGARKVRKSHVLFYPPRGAIARSGGAARTQMPPPSRPPDLDSDSMGVECVASTPCPRKTIQPAIR